MRIYIAGPYTLGDTIANVRAAIEAAEALLAKGHTPYIPHLSTLWHLVAPHPAEFWYAYDLKWLTLCDAVLRLPGESVGADAEVKAALVADKPTYYDLAAVPENAPAGADVQLSLFVEGVNA
mgnify:FL=1